MKKRVLRSQLTAALLTGITTSVGVYASDDATLSVPPLHPTIPIAPADIDGPQVTFREVAGGTLNSANSNLPVAADEGLWRRSKGVPIGSRIHLHVSDASVPAD